MSNGKATSNFSERASRGGRNEKSTENTAARRSYEDMVGKVVRMVNHQPFAF